MHSLLLLLLCPFCTSTLKSSCVIYNCKFNRLLQTRPEFKLAIEKRGLGANWSQKWPQKLRIDQRDDFVVNNEANERTNKQTILKCHLEASNSRAFKKSALRRFNGEICKHRYVWCVCL